MMTFPDQKLTLTPRPLVELSFSELELLVNRLQEEKAELLQIALHLSQAVTRMGNSAFGIDSYDQHNEAVAMAQACQENLQEWIAGNLAHALPTEFKKG